MKTLKGKFAFSHILVGLLCLLVIGVYMVRSLEAHYYASTRSLLFSQARLVDRLSHSVSSDVDLQAVAESAANATGSRITIIASDGTVLADTMEVPSQMENHRNRPELVQAAREGAGTAIRYSSTVGADMMYVAVPVQWEQTNVGWVRVALPLKDVNDALRSVWVSLGSGIFFAILVASGTGWLLANRMSRPVQEMISLAKEISAGDFSRRTSVIRQDEIGELSAALNHMAENLQQQVKEITDSTRCLEAVLIGASSGVVFVKSGGRLSIMNPAARRILRVSSTDIEGKHIHEVLRNYKLSHLIESVLADCAERRAEILLPQGDMVLDVTVRPVAYGDGNGHGAVAILHDITEIRRLERVRSEFIANVSHELRTPITSIKGFAETLLNHEYPQDISREFLQIIHAESERVSRLVSDLLDLSRLESHMTRFNLVEADASGIVRSAIARLLPEIEKAHLEVECRITPDPFTAIVDPDRLHQILGNLLDNAIKYNVPGGKIKVSLTRDGESMRLAVSDTGIGIAEDHLPRVFERFYRVDKTRSRGMGGTGLGLAIVKHLAEALGGSVSASSTAGHGSTFQVILPLCPQQRFT
ncbi:MAG: two-component system histidine kinase PnpS [Bacillota bacterium]